MAKMTTVFLLVVFLSLISVSLVSSHSYSIWQAAAFAGKGAWMWKLWKLDGETPEAIIQTLSSVKADWVGIKAGDGDCYWLKDGAPDCVSGRQQKEWINEHGGIANIINKFHQAGIRIVFWQFVYGNDDTPGVPNATEASVALQILSISNIDGFIVNAETVYDQEGKDDEAENYMSALRARYPDIPIAYSSFARVSGHEWFPWLQFGKYSDVNMPQTYWGLRTPRKTPEQELQETKNEFDNWHQIWEDSGYEDSVKPIMPVGQGGTFVESDGNVYPIYQGEIGRFCNQARSYGYAGTSLFRYGEDVMQPWAWNEYSQCSNEYLLALLRTEPEQGFSPLPVTLFVESASNVSGTMNFSLWWHCEYRGVSVNEAEAICGVLPHPLAGQCQEGMRGVKCEAVYPLTLSISHTYEHEGIYFPKVIVEQGTWAIEDRARVIVSSLNTPTPLQTPTTPTKTSTVPSTSTVTVSPSFTNTPPVSATPGATATLFSTSTSSPTPSPDPSLTPGAVSIVAVWTTNESNLAKSLFGRGESIRYWFETEAQAQLQGVRSDWLAQGACGPILSETWSLNIPQGRSRLALQRSIPEDACLGAYVFQLTLIYNNQTISKATSFSVVAQTAPPSSTSTSTATPSATPSTTVTSSPSATTTPEPTVTAGQTATPSICYDINGDGIVDMDDIQLVADAWRAPSPAYDLDEDNQVTIRDIMLVAKSWGDVCSRTPTPSASPSVTASATATTAVTVTVTPSATATCCAPPPTPPLVAEPSATCVCPGPPTEVP